MSLPGEDVQHFQNRKLKKDSFRQPQLIFHTTAPVPSTFTVENNKQNLDILAPLSLLKELQTILAAFPKLFEILPLIQKLKTNWINLDYLCRLSRQPPASYNQ
ncbi:hypothetical protein CEXT_113611 [Caerostris extrusa]|uniref:Uncharacterized protein n=1 Tax=Caerostris extrusa TaxID=172846 RepID=A0AAV4YC13_CAEEX|nr:hypothetical protein CEXT_113611 [Caerostris extrusa]